MVRKTALSTARERRGRAFVLSSLRVTEARQPHPRVTVFENSTAAAVRGQVRGGGGGGEAVCADYRHSRQAVENMTGSRYIYTMCSPQPPVTTWPCPCTTSTSSTLCHRHPPSSVVVEPSYNEPRSGRGEARRGKERQRGRRERDERWLYVCVGICALHCPHTSMSKRVRVRLAVCVWFSSGTYAYREGAV